MGSRRGNEAGEVSAYCPDTGTLFGSISCNQSPTSSWTATGICLSPQPFNGDRSVRSPAGSRDVIVMELSRAIPDSEKSRVVCD